MFVASPLTSTLVSIISQACGAQRHRVITGQPLWTQPELRDEIAETWQSLTENEVETVARHVEANVGVRMVWGV